MNCEQANKISIVQILENLGHQPKRKTQRYYKYLSPFRLERTASFSVNLQNNYWHDFGTDEGGNTIAFGVKHLQVNNEAHTISDALRWINNMAGGQPFIRPVSVEVYPPTEHILQLKAAYTLQHPSLIQYIENRGIPEPLAKIYLDELRIYNQESKKSYVALGFKNESGGYDFRTKYLKACVGKKDISFIRGTKEVQDKIHLFEGGIDFLSRLRMKGILQLEDDALILHSLSLLKEAPPLIQNYTYKSVYSWFDNDKAGEKATVSVSEFCQTQHDLVHKSMSVHYQDHKDLNDCLVSKLGLKGLGS